MNNEKTQTGMDFPHDMPRPDGKKAVHTRLTPPTLTKKMRKKLAAIQRSIREDTK